MREADEEEEEKEEKDDDETTLMKLTVAQLKERLRSNGLEAEKGWKKKDFVAGRRAHFRWLRVRGRAIFLTPALEPRGS